MATGYSSIGLIVEVGPLIGSGVLTYTSPIASARTEPGQEAAPTAIGSFSYFTSTAHPNTGSFIEGWKWDERVWSEESIENSVGYVPNNWDPTTSGITETYFQSGIGGGDDLKLVDIQTIPSSGLNSDLVGTLWTPEINHGYYYRYSEQDYLFSDSSEIEFVTYSGLDENSYEPASGFNYVTLSGIPKVGIPIRVSQYEWNSSEGRYETTLSLTKKINFTGERDSDGVQLSTYDSAREIILYDNVDQTQSEFIVTYSGTYPKVILNNQYSEVVGAGTVPYDLEILGYATGNDNQQFYTRYSPIDRSIDINVYSYLTTSGTITQWTPVTTSDTMLSGGNYVCVDYDLGTLEFGSTALAQNIPAVGETIGISYHKTVAVEYELQDTKNTILAMESNLNSVNRQNSQGFIYLKTELSDPASITLEASLPVIQTNSFGPLSIGNSVAPVIATVKDSQGNTLEGQRVTISITSSPSIGTFGTSTSTETISNALGQARAYYIPPQGISDIGEEIPASQWSEEASPTDPTYSGLSEITRLSVNNLLIEGDLSDIFLYQVYTDDPLQGILNVSLATDYTTQINDYYSTFFNDYEIYGGTRDVEWEDAHRLIWDLSRPSVYTANTGMGRRQIVSAVDSTALNPYTFEPGAVAPIQPYAVEEISGGYNVVYNTSVYDIPKPTGTDTVPSGTFYSYFMVAPTTVSMQASVYNERLNRYITSDEISIKLTVPSYLNGVWLLDAINQSHIDEISSLLASGITASGQRVPLGFRLRSSQVTLAAALDGVTFLDINRPWNSDQYDPDNVPESGVQAGEPGVYLGQIVNVVI